MNDEDCVRRRYVISSVLTALGGSLAGFGSGIWASSTHGHSSQNIKEGEFQSFDLPYDHDDLGWGNFEVANENIKGQNGDYQAKLTLREADSILEGSGQEFEVGGGYVGPGNYEAKLPEGETVGIEVENVTQNEVKVALEYKSDKMR